MHAAADKSNMTVEDPLGSDEEEEGSEDEEDGESDGATGSESEDNDDGSGKLLKATLEARQAARAAGDHPLQQSFRAAAAQLLEKYATADKKRRKQKGGKDANTGGQGTPKLDEEEEQQGSEDQAEEEDDDEGEEEEESQDDSAAGSSAEENEQQASSDVGSSEVSDDDEEEPKQPPSPNQTQHGDAQRTDRQKAHAEAQSSAQAHAGGDMFDDIPYTIPAPSSYAAFAQLAGGQGPTRLGLIIQRIRACNALALATDNRRKLQASQPSQTSHFSVCSTANRCLLIWRLSMKSCCCYAAAESDR